MTHLYNDTCFYRRSCLDLLVHLFSMYDPQGYTYFRYTQIVTDFPTAEHCSNLAETFESLAYSVANWSHIEGGILGPPLIPMNMEGCAIVCGEADPRAVFLFLGASSPMATGMCIFVVALMVLASLYLLAAILQHEAQWIPTLGSLTMSAGFAFFVVLYSEPSDQARQQAMYNPQPVIAAMNAAIFSYFFSGFQYAISPGYEFGPAVSLLAAGYPLWLNLVAVPFQPYHPKPFPVLLARTGLAMPIVSLIWIIHSALYRTIGYRAAWIRAWRLSQYAPADNSTPRKHMSSLWTLAAAQEQPTWRSTPGQSTGALLLILAWIIVFNYDDTCETENILLLKAMIYVPPMLLTVATIWNQVMISFFESNSHVAESFIQDYKWCKAAASPTDIKGQILSTIGSALSAWSKLEVASQADYTDSIIAYKLGRNMVYVEPNINIYKGFQDTIFGFSLWIIEIGLQLLSLPICWVLVLSRMCLRWIGAIGIGCIFYFTTFQTFECAIQQFCDARRSTMKLRACKILCKHCGEDIVVWTSLEENLLPFEVDAKVRDILSKHTRKINLNELLECSRPIELLYLLSHLDDVLASTRSPNIEQVVELNDVENSNNLNKRMLKRYVTFS